MRVSGYVGKDELILDLARGHSVLHIGCIGFSDLPAAERVSLAPLSLHWRLSQVARTIGVDYSKSVVEECRQLGIFDNVVWGDAQQLDEVPINTKFDIVVAADIIEHLSSPGAMLEG